MSLPRRIKRLVGNDTRLTVSFSPTWNMCIKWLIEFIGIGMIIEEYPPLEIKHFTKWPSAAELVHLGFFFWFCWPVLLEDLVPDPANTRTCFRYINPGAQRSGESQCLP